MALRSVHENGQKDEKKKKRLLQKGNYSKQIHSINSNQRPSTMFNINNQSNLQSSNITFSQPTSYSNQIADVLLNLQQQILPLTPDCKFQHVLYNKADNNLMINKPPTKNVEQWEIILNNRKDLNSVPICLDNVEHEYLRLKLQQSYIIAIRTTLNKLYLELYEPTKEQVLNNSILLKNLITKLDKLNNKIHIIISKIRLLTMNDSQDHNNLKINMETYKINQSIKDSNNKIISNDCWNRLSILKNRFNTIKSKIDVLTNNDNNEDINHAILNVLELQQEGIVYLDKVVTKDIKDMNV